MMKSMIALMTVFICYSANLYAQDSLYTVINKQTCSCITSKSAKDFGLADYQNCIRQTLNNNSKAILGELKKSYPDSVGNYKKGYDYGQAIGSRLDTDLVYTCDAYFRIADTLRSSSYQVNNKDSLRQLLVDLNNPGTPRDIMFYQHRALTNFLLGLMDDADRDALEVFKQNPNSIVALFIHANYLETNHEFAEAASLYYRLDQLTGQHAYLVSAAINNRKHRELH